MSNSFMPVTTVHFELAVVNDGVVSVAVEMEPPKRGRSTRFAGGGAWFPLK